jgi:glucosamine--fructose-6-phosphate aminotransferase (isomerizing)
MCGIIAILANRPVAEDLVESLRRLEYRGYDSAGIAVLEQGRIARVRAEGKLVNLERKTRDAHLTSGAGIGHTRWATHGEPTETNAHPHAAGRAAIVHNGIIENFRELRRELEQDGRVFHTQTDSETIAHLIDRGLSEGHDAREAFRRAISRLRGAFAIAALIEGEDNIILGARKGSPLVIGVGDGEMMLGSDALAVGPFTSRIIYLEDDDWCWITRDGAEIRNAAGEAVRRPQTIVAQAGAAAEKGAYRHFMQKEIYEQPEFISRTVSAYVNGYAQSIALPVHENKKPVDFRNIDRIQIIACGTAYYAGCVAKYWFEQIAGIATDTDIASEFRYREPVLTPRTLAIAVTQSGETADTRAALDYCRKAGVPTAAVVNVLTSSIAREADSLLPTLAGVEIGVASTKAFTAQLCALLAAAIAAARARGHIAEDTEKAHVQSLMELPRLMTEALRSEDDIRAYAVDLARRRDAIFLGRGAHYPLALEGALKLKEISYIHAEGYASGELKHGPIALIDEATPVIMCAPHDRLFEKSLSNLQEVVARRGKVLLITDQEGAEAAAGAAQTVILIPTCPTILQPIIAAAPLQLLAYHVAVEKGTDVDQPRNLAKSVTVE